jgi:ribose/xylose/arabinose/galactoside ABC-type transport system permease subunit
MKIAIASPDSEVVRPGAHVGFRARVDHYRGLIIAIGALLAMMIAWVSLSATPVGLYDIGSVISSSATLALAGIGQTIVVLSGGFDLSASAVVSLSNVLAVRFVQGTPLEQWGGVALILAIGGGIGLVNGALIAWFRLQSIVVTLATMFMVQGLTLLIQNKPGGSIGDQFGAFITSDLVPDKVPMSAAVLVVALLVWTFVKRTRFGVGLYALGSDPDGAYANGMPVRGYRIATYALAGMFYAAAGLYVSAQTGSADPLVGRPLLLSMFTAVVLGGTWLGGGRGGCVGTVFAAMTLMITVNILLVLNVSAFFTTIAEAVILILAVLGSSVGKQSAAHHCARYAERWFTAWRTGTRARNDPGARRVKFEVENFRPIENTELKGHVLSDWIERNREWVKYVVPAYLLFFAVIAITGVVYGPGVLASANFYTSLLTLTLFLAVLGLGQGAVILTGGLDLSVPWLITLSGVLLTGLTHGVNEAAACAAGAMRRLAGRRVQRRRGRRAGLAADRGHACCQRLAAGDYADLLQRIAAGMGALRDQQFHKRARGSLVARCVVRTAVPCIGIAVAASHGLWATRLCGRQFAGSGEAVGRACGRNLDRGVLPLRFVFGCGGPVACRLQQPGFPRHGRPLFAAFHCSGGRGRCVDHRRPRSLSWCIRRRVAADRAGHATRRYHRAARRARHHQRPRCTGCRDHVA